MKINKQKLLGSLDIAYESHETIITENTNDKKAVKYNNTEI